MLVDEIPSRAATTTRGDLHFGNDGYLYVSVGDGGCDYAGDSGCAGAERRVPRPARRWSGRSCGSRRTGGIPPTIPFQGAGTARCNVTGRTTAGNKCQETFAWGLRNPFRFAFDPNAAGTRFFINDVGQGDVGGDRPRAGRRRLRLERPRGAVRERLGDELRRRRRPG